MTMEPAGGGAPEFEIHGGPAPAGAPASRGFLLALLAFCSFSIVFNNLIISPVLKDVAADLDVRLGVAGLLITVYALFGGILAFVSGPFVDRYGRRRILLAGIATLSVATFLSALAPTYLTMVACRALAGLGVAMLQPAVFAAVGDYFPYHERGKAMAWLITANTAASVVGVPVGALLAEVVSWRWTFAMLGGVTFLGTLLIYFQFPAERKRTPVVVPSFRADYMAIVRNRQTMALLGSNMFGSMFWFAWVTYMGAFFVDEFDLSTGQLAPVLSSLGLGILVGSNVGGRLADRIGKKPIVLVSGLLFAPIIIIQTAFPTVVWAGVLLNFACAMPVAARFVSVTSMVGEAMPTRRGTVMAWNSAAMQVGVMSGSAVGALVVEFGSYALLGFFIAAISLLSTWLVTHYVDERDLIPIEAGANG